MQNPLFIAPSIDALFFTGLMLLFITIIVIYNFKAIMKLGFYQKLTLLSLLTIAIGIHGLIHLGVEYVYNFNPFIIFFRK